MNTNSVAHCAYMFELAHQPSTRSTGKCLQKHEDLGKRQQVHTDECIYTD